MKRDLSGRYVLLSEHFYYFGSQPISIPKKCQIICHTGAGHHWRPNEGIKNDFVKWLEEGGHPLNTVQSLPAEPPERKIRCGGTVGGMSKKSKNKCHNDSIPEETNLNSVGN